MTERSFACELGEWMRTERKKLKLSKSDVARVLGVSVTTVSSYERGETVMSAFHHRVLKAYFRREHGNGGNLDGPLKVAAR